jgi:hypothetical protein
LYFQQIYQASSITVHPYEISLTLDHIILCTSISCRASYKCCRCVYSAYCAWEDITCDRVIMLCHRSSPWCYSAAGYDILGNVLPRYE